jgi:hypothetical protein
MRLLVLPLSLLLILALILLLISLRVAMPELLRWVAWETRATVAPRLGSTYFALLVFHLLALPLCHDSPINQMLEGREGVVHQSVMQGINQSSQKSVLPLSISVDIL